MPSLQADSHGIPAVAAFKGLLDELLQRAQIVKPSSSIEPALKRPDFEDLQTKLRDVFPTADPATEEKGDSKRAKRFAVIETAARDTLSTVVATTSIESPAFVRVWNLFDILSILSDSGQCEPALLFWLVEELLDSQTIAGCRKVFDFLESRRETITNKHFDSKKLAILRTCNELLRRLSRAEDTAFCGRVFIFLYQSFPLGDRSSVNLRGEYHVENVTTFDQDLPNKDEDAEKMDIDTQNGDSKNTPDPKGSSKGVALDAKKGQHAEKPLDPDSLYPIFWSLQASFNQPKKLFDAPHFAEFKAGLEATMTTFRTIKPDQGSRPVKQEKQTDDAKRSLKRKREASDEDELASAFNPKYLTSRDLFELEINDLSFRRHILVQSLITMDFLLSLSAKAKEKLNTAKIVNKGVTYFEQLLSEEDTKWVFAMKKTIADYLRQGTEGPYFFRMVETVLSRDKNWVRWKIENCPSIEKPPVSPEEFCEAKAAAQKLTTNKRLRPTPMGSLSLGFLSDVGEGNALQKLKSQERYVLPDLMSFKRKIADDDFEIEMPTNNQTKAAAIEGKASKSWRALRIASRYKLATFDKLDNPEKIDLIFEDDVPQEAEELEDTTTGPAHVPEDRRPVIITGPQGSNKSSLVKMLLEKESGAFGKVAAHITRQPENGETNGREYHFVEAQAFAMMRDGDQLLAFTDAEGVNYGTSRRAVESISDSGKVPLLEMDRSDAQQVKDNGYSARFVFVKPPGDNVLRATLEEGGLDSDKVEEVLKSAAEDTTHAHSGDFYDLVVVDDELDNAYKVLEEFIYGSGSSGEQLNGDQAHQAAGTDVQMDDAPTRTQPRAEQTNGVQG